MKPFIGNPCGHPYCLWEERYDCPAFKPKLFNFIPLPRWLGKWLFKLEEQLFYKKHIVKTEDNWIKF